jgi:hypothetical protein
MRQPYGVQSEGELSPNALVSLPESTPPVESSPANKVLDVPSSPSGRK